jgi:hypothetical protein
MMDKSRETLSSVPLLVKAETVAWLRERLSAGPQRIASLVAEWCGGQQAQAKGDVVWEGGRDGTNGRFLAELMGARHMLGAVALLDDAGCYCWRLPPGRQ